MMRPVTAASYSGRRSTTNNNNNNNNSTTGAIRRPVTASENSGSRSTLIGRPSLVSAAERARILQAQRAAALRRRNVQLRIAKIEAEPVAEWQSSSKPLTLHHRDDSVSVTKAVEPSAPPPQQQKHLRHSPVPPPEKRIIVTKPASPRRPRASSPSPPSPIIQSRSHPEYSSSSSEEEEEEEGIRGLVDDGDDDDDNAVDEEGSHDEASHEDSMAVHALPLSSPKQIGRPVSTTRSSRAAVDAVAEPLHQFDIASLGLDDSARMREFLTSPCPKEAGTIQCYIRRHKVGAKKSLFPEYRVYLKEGDTFLLTSKKRKNKKTANYLISMGRNDFDKASDNIIGKLRSNFLGTEFQIYDAGRNPNSSTAYFDERSDVPIRSELGAVVYSSNLIGSRGPRQMQVCINRIDDDTGKSTKAWQPAHRDEEMIQCFKHRVPAALRHLVVLENKEPQWNEDLGAHVLNFNGRVTQASVKNFQLIDKSTHHHEEGRLDKRGKANNGASKSDAVILQFGRVAKDEFTLDFQWPLTPVQAFAIALSSCDGKLACD